jgi:hypothetical protein
MNYLKDYLIDEVSVFLYTRFESRRWLYTLLFNLVFPSQQTSFNAVLVTQSLLSDASLFVTRDYEYLIQRCLLLVKQRL